VRYELRLVWELSSRLDAAIGGKCPDAGPVGTKHACVKKTLQLQLSVARWLGVGGFNEQPCVIGGVFVCVCSVVVQGKTMRPRATIIRVENNQVNCLPTHRALRVTRRGHGRWLETRWT